MPTNTATRRLPMGAEPLTGGGTHFRVWAPGRDRIELVLDTGAGDPRATPTDNTLAVELDREPSGSWFQVHVPGATAGSRYRFRLDGSDELLKDPASRFQPEGPLGPSEVIDPSRFRWTDGDWSGLTREGQVLYEMHVGTFTKQGSWAAAAARLVDLADVGITVVELMPVADFVGSFGWGYDGVDLFAPTRLYGTPDDFRAFVDRAHALGIGVILDVVYNHSGPVGSSLSVFAPAYFSERHATDWGPAYNFDGTESEGARALILSNAAYWISEFHIDGLRLDATQSMFDDSVPHILTQITEAARSAGGGRSTFVVGENEPQHARLLAPEAAGGNGIDALWNDDFHHTARVALTGRVDGYYNDYRGTAQELLSCARRGYLYQGQWYSWQKQRRGTPTTGFPACRFVHYLQNHDQVANSARGERIHQLAAPAAVRTMTALLLLGPQTPMLFQGQEFAASTPFLYFADHRGRLGEDVRHGRAGFLTQFRDLATDEVQARLPDPLDRATFDRSRLDWTERDANAHVVALHRDLIALRRAEPAIRAAAADRSGVGVDGAVLAPDAFLVRYPGDGGDERLLLVNLGRRLHMNPVPEPLMAPPAGAFWRLLWSSEDPVYGGSGTPELETPDDGWIIPAYCAVLLGAERNDGLD